MKFSPINTISTLFMPVNHSCQQNRCINNAGGWRSGASVQKGQKVECHFACMIVTIWVITLILLFKIDHLDPIQHYMNTSSGVY